MKCLPKSVAKIAILLIHYVPRNLPKPTTIGADLKVVKMRGYHFRKLMLNNQHTDLKNSNSANSEAQNFDDFQVSELGQKDAAESQKVGRV